MAAELVTCIIQPHLLSWRLLNNTAKHTNVRKINGKDYDVTATVYISSLGVPHFVSDILHITMGKNLAFYFSLESQQCELVR